MRKLSAVIVTTTAVFMLSCNKNTDNPPGNNNQCASMTTVKATASSATIEKGQTLSFQSPALSGVTYKWQTPGGTQITSADGTISNVDFNNEGWFYMEAKNNCNEIKKDSFFVDVIIPQGTPSCSPANNAISFSAANHTASSFTSVSHGETGVPDDAYRLQASGGGNDLTIAFHPSFKNNKQPENGVYTTGTFNANGNPSFGTNDYDKVFVVDITYSPSTIYYRSNPNQKVYISRTNGKLKASICNMSFAGSSSGTPYATDITFAIVEN